MVRRLVAVSLVVALGGCFSSGNEQVAEPSSTTSTTDPPTTPTTTMAPGLWAKEAFGFFEALRYVVPDRVDRFFAPTVQFEGSPSGDLEDLEVALEMGLNSPLFGEVERLYLSEDQAAFEAVWPPPLWIGEVVEGRVVRVISESLQDFEGYWRDPDPFGPRLGAIHERYFPAWTAGDADRIATLFQPGALRVDSLFDSTQRPDVAADMEIPHLDALVGAGVRYQPVSTTADLDGDGEYGEEWAVFTAKAWREEPSAAHVMLDVIGSDCTLRLLAEWEIEGDRIAAEEILYEVDSLRRCADRAGVDLPDGWWTDLEVPEPFLETVTGQVTTGDGSRITIINGTPEQIALVEWALGRFTAAGPPLPHVAIVAFPPTRLCKEGGHSGYASLGAEAVRLDVCGDDAGTEDRRTVLHELGHAWNEQQVDEATRQAFLDLRGLAEWTPTEPDTVWEEGIEQAAETIAWGLMDQPIVVKIPDTTPEDLAEAFRLLTGVEPLNTP